MPGHEVRLNVFIIRLQGRIRTVACCLSLKRDNTNVTCAREELIRCPHVFANGLLPHIQHRAHSFMSHLLKSEWSFQKGLTVDRQEDGQTDSAV